jgi:integrase
MARPATGQLVEPKNGRGWAMRFRAYGKRRFVTLGSSDDGWNRQRAEAELRHVLADVERGTWRPYEPAPVDSPIEVPTFHQFASEWLAARESELAPKTVKDYRWALSYHLLPFLANYRLSEIDAAVVDRYKATKARGRALAPAQINKTLKRLAQILELAVDYGYLPRNPAASKGGRRRVKEPKPKRSWVEPEQLMTLLEAAPRGHRPVSAMLAGAGLRVGEACALDWRDVNLATGTITVRVSKTDAGTGRQVDLPLGLADELRAHKAAAGAGTGADAPMFLSGPRHGRRARQTPDIVGGRLKTAIRRANERLAEAGIEAISDRVSPHSLRRTTPAFGRRAGTTRCTSPSSLATRTRRSRSVCTRRPQSGARGCRGSTWQRSIARLIGQQWAAGPSRAPLRHYPRPLRRWSIRLPRAVQWYRAPVAQLERAAAF